ncbi:MAG: hypothetical protein DCO96_06835 [Fluviicola sp. XM-24bin1]|nr:MAG: hypothetical protein DCO96_06835 [Fluviicola sp. XM-24bin1]
MKTEAEREDKERIKREKMRKLESPIPFVIVLRNWIFGKRRPDIFTRITFIANLVIWMLFLIWSGFSYFAVNSRDWILQQKGIRVTSIINERGTELGFENGVFMDRMETASLIAIVCWLVFFVGLVLLYRKKRIFVYFSIVPLLAYVALNSIYLGFAYFIEDITLFDKILILISLLSLSISVFMMRSGGENTGSSFFGVPTEEDVPETT